MEPRYATGQHGNSFSGILQEQIKAKELARKVKLNFSNPAKTVISFINQTAGGQPNYHNYHVHGGVGPNSNVSSQQNSTRYPIPNADILTAINYKLQ
jgi:hypothetical protein